MHLSWGKAEIFKVFEKFFASDHYILQKKKQTQKKKIKENLNVLKNWKTKIMYA